MTKQEKIEKLASLTAEALKIIEQYNLIAEEENLESRIGLIDAEVETFQFSDGEENEEVVVPENLGDWLLKNGQRPYWSTRFPGTKSRVWAASGINC